MRIEQVQRTFDEVYDKVRQQVFKTVVDEVGNTRLLYEAYYYVTYDKRANIVEEKPKGSSVDLNA